MNWLAAAPPSRRCSPLIVWFAVFVLAGSFLGRLGDFPLRGEETRWAQVVREMLARHDFIVPRQQGEPFLSRPPLHHWLMGIVSSVRGSVDAVSVRLPSVLATLLTSLVIYGYSRTFLSPIGAIAAAVAFPTMGEVIKTARLAETEALFTTFVSSSLLIWHWGYRAGWPRWRLWLVSYTLVALGSLTKGPQAPLYFGLSVWGYLVLTRQWKTLIARSHAMGIAVSFAILLAWQIPFGWKLGWAGVIDLWTDDAAARAYGDIGSIMSHAVRYPLEMFLCTGPWSWLLPAFLNSGFRRDSWQIEAVRYLVFCLAICFATVWLMPGSATRHFQPLYPCLAPLIGLVIERVARPGDVQLAVRWRVFRGLCAGAMLLIALGVMFVSAMADRWPPHSAWSGLVRSPLFCGVYLAMTVGCVTIVLRAQIGRPQQVAAGVLAIACFLALTCSGVYINYRASRMFDVASAVDRVQRLIPPDEPLVSFGPAHHLFVFHYDRPIPILAPGSPVSEWRYFCFNIAGNERPAFPFAWKELAAIPMDRYQTNAPKNQVVVGCRRD